MDPQALRTLVTDAVQAKLDAGETFTSACISHPIIKNNSDVRHRHVNGVIRDLWANGGIQGDDGDGMQVDYCRTLINVYPDGPGSKTVQANLYHPDNGYDPYSFTLTTRVLIRNPDTAPVSPAAPFDMDGDVDDDDSGSGSLSLIVHNTASGDSVAKQTTVQAKNAAINIPRFVIKSAGFEAGDKVLVICDLSAKTVIICKAADTVNGTLQVVDKEGRVRLHGARVATLCGTPTPTPGASFKAMLVVPDSGDKYIQVGS